MSLSLVLGVVVGLSSVYLALSLAATGAQDLVAAALRWRSRTLAAAIREAVEPAGRRGDPRREVEAPWSAGAGVSVRLRLAEGLFKALYRHPLIWLRRAEGDLPVRLPTGDLAVALLDLLARAGGEESPDDEPVARLRRGMRSVGNVRARTVLTSMLRAAEAPGGSVQARAARFTDAVASWFDAMMERASAVYRRRAYAVAFGLGLALALACNVDTIGIARALWRDGLLAEAVRAEVEHGAAGAMDRLAGIGLPLGWGAAGFPSGPWALWLLGILLTAAAVAQGSPIWFDVLKRITSVRLAGRGVEPPGDD